MSDRYEPHDPKQHTDWMHTCLWCQSVAICRERAYSRYQAMGHTGTEADCLSGCVGAVLESSTIPHVIVFVPERAWVKIAWAGVCPRNLKIHGLSGQCATVRP